MKKLGKEDHTYHAAEEELERYSQELTKIIRMDVLELAGMRIIKVFAEPFKKDTKCQLQILPT